MGIHCDIDMQSKNLNSKVVVFSHDPSWLSMVVTYLVILKVIVQGDWPDRKHLAKPCEITFRVVISYIYVYRRFLNSFYSNETNRTPSYFII